MTLLNREPGTGAPEISNMVPSFQKAWSSVWESEPYIPAPATHTTNRQGDSGSEAGKGAGCRMPTIPALPLKIIGGCRSIILSWRLPWPSVIPCIPATDTK